MVVLMPDFPTLHSFSVKVQQFFEVVDLIQVVSINVCVCVCNSPAYMVIVILSHGQQYGDAAEWSSFANSKMELTYQKQFYLGHKHVAFLRFYHTDKNTSIKYIIKNKWVDSHL